MDAIAPGRPLLLASAATLEDVATAISGGADVVDLKDPAAGALGAPTFATLAATAALRDRIDPARPLSAAIGSARDPEAAARAAAAARAGFAFVKAGLDGVADGDEAAALLCAIGDVLRRAGDRTRLVAATFAEAGSGALEATGLPDVAARAGCAGCLLDTLVKDGRTLFDHRSDADLGRFVAAAHRRGLFAALAGSLAERDVGRAATLQPDLIGLRGALCAGGRAGRLDPARVRRFASMLEAVREQARAR